MVPYGSSAGEGGSRPSKQPPTSRQMDIEKATELFRKQLEESNKKTQDSQPSVKGGLPPHLLRQKKESPHAGIKDTSNASPSWEQQSCNRPFGSPAAHGKGQSQAKATPLQVSASLSQPPRQQQCRLQSNTTPSQVHPAREFHAITSKRTTHRQANNPSSALVQRQQSVDNATRGTPMVGSALLGLRASRWTGGPQPVQRQIHKEQSPSHDEQRALVPAGGLRLSVNTYDDWTPFNRNDGEKYQQMNNTENTELQQTKLKKWRPKHSCDLQSQDLPDSLAFSLNFSDSDPNSVRENGTLGSPDIRNTVGGELDLVPKIYGEGFYNKHRWDEYPDQTKSLEWRPTYCQLWVKEVEKEEWPVAVFLNVKEMPHEECDVQTSNGWLMAPVDYPDTHINPEEARGAQFDGVVSRRLTASSALKMKADHRRLKRRVDDREREVKWQPTEDPFPVASPAYWPSNRPSQEPVGQRTGQPTPPATQSYANRSPVTRTEPTTHRPERTVQHPVYGAITHMPRTFEARGPPTYLKIACFLRPADENDIPQLLEIYNWEVSHGMQALDTNRLCLKDMERLFKRCRGVKTPIIVAVAGTSAEAKARRELPVTSRGCQRLQQSSQKPEKDKIIGFSYVSILTPGLAGDVFYNVGRFLGQIHIYVTHECRRKGIGRALLQRMTIFCSRYAGQYANEYEWYDPAPTPTYDNVFYNSRSYSRIFIEFASRAKDDPDTLWMSKFLDTENFICVATQDKARKIGYGKDGQMVDCLVWQHDCQDLEKIKEIGPKT